MPGASKLRVIADTNAWISRFILPDSLTGQRMKRLAADKRITFVFSQTLKEELRAVLQRPKFRKYITAENLTVFRAYLDVFPTTPNVSRRTVPRPERQLPAQLGAGQPSRLPTLRR